MDQTFTIDNTFPLGGQRTIGYWKNWNTCSHDGAFQARAAKTGNHLADEFLPQTLGTYEVDTCEEAVAVLNKSPLNAKKAASNAAYNLAAQLLAAKLNIAAGASTCASVTTAIADADALLTAVGFNGTTLPNLTPAQKTLANQLADFLDQYNNGLIC